MYKQGWLFFVSLTLAYGCGTDEPTTTYHRDVRPLVEQHCTSCHVEGGVGPFRLDRAEDAETYGPLMTAAVADRRMPPWPAADDCHPLRDVAALDEEGRQIFADWEDSDFALGDPEDYVAPELPEQQALGDPDVVMGSGDTYEPDPDLTDDYRCFVMEGTFDEDTYVTAMDILPGVRSLVHHVQIHIIPADGLTEAGQLDEASDGHGYTCFGGVSVAGAVNVFSWRPGSTGVAFEEGDAGLIPAGSAAVIQVHYNTQWIEAGETAEADETRIAFWTMPAGELPERIVARRMLANFPLNIPAGDDEVVVTGTTSGMRAAAVGGTSFGGGTFVPGEIVGMTPHMHNLGKAFRVTVADGEGDSCLIDVPTWSFEWQLDYMFSPDSYVPVSSSDQFELTCVFDNSVDNQPVVLGERQQPRRVGWGDGSLDEMCLNYVWMRYERDAYLDALGR